MTDYALFKTLYCANTTTDTLCFRKTVPFLYPSALFSFSSGSVSPFSHHQLTQQAGRYPALPWNQQGH